MVEKKYLHKVFILILGFIIGMIVWAFIDPKANLIAVATTSSIVLFSITIVNSWFYKKQNIIFRIIISGVFLQIAMNVLLNINEYLFKFILINPYTINNAFVSTTSYIVSLSMWMTIAFISMIIDDAVAYYIFKFRERPCYYLDKKVLFSLPKRKDDMSDD